MITMSKSNEIVVIGAGSLLFVSIIYLIRKFKPKPRIALNPKTSKIVLPTKTKYEVIYNNMTPNGGGVLYLSGHNFTLEMNFTNSSTGSKFATHIGDLLDNYINRSNLSGQYQLQAYDKDSMKKSNIISIYIKHN